MDEHESAEEQPRALPDSIWREVQNEYARAKRKHGEMTPDGDVTSDLNRLATVTEEVGEVARCLTYDQDHAGNLRKELIQLGTMALAWASRLAR